MSPPQRSIAVVAALLVALAVALPTAGAVAVPAAGAVDAPSDDAVAPSGSGAPAVGAAPAPIQDEGPGADRFAQAVDADSVKLAVALQPDGDATWTVTYRVRLEDDDETDAFESLRADVESDPDNYTARFGDRMRSTAAAAGEATGREMAVRDVTVEARTQSVPSYGILEYTFEWTNFAAVEGDTVTAGDALAGLFLDESTTLVFSWPEGYGLVDARPGTDPDLGGERSAGWAGPADFGDDEPRVVVRAGAGDRGGLPLAALLAGGLLAAVGLGAAVTWYRRRGAPGVPGGDGGRGGDADGGAGAGGVTSDAPDEPPEELLSNEEKVLKLVRERGGRVKQQEIVEAFDWTEAKTSQVVRDLREKGDLEGFRLGRENVLRLPGEDENGS